MSICRQGDVLLRRVASAPGRVTELAAGRVILAYGEKTGHAHVVDVVAAAEAVVEAVLVEDALGQRYLRVTGGPVDVIHEEHAPVTLDPGTYEVRLQREYEPLGEPVLRSWSD